MIYKFNESVFLKKDSDKVYLYSLKNESLVVQATGQLSALMEKLKKGCELPEIAEIFGEAGTGVFHEIYDRLTSADFTIAAKTEKVSVKGENFSSPFGLLQFTSFEELLGSTNAAVYASYCATSSCSYCDNCSCSDC